MEGISKIKTLPLFFAAPVSWYTLALSMPCLNIADEPNFEKQTLRNRIHYGTFQGPRLYSIPLVNSTTGGPFRGVMISYSENWQSKLIHALQTAYGKSPFFEFYGYRFELIINEKFEALWDLNMAIFYETLHCLKWGNDPVIIKSPVIGYSATPPVTEYYQVFRERINFMPDLSILDLLYNEGPDTAEILLNKIKPSLNYE